MRESCWKRVGQSHPGEFPLWTLPRGTKLWVIPGGYSEGKFHIHGCRRSHRVLCEAPCCVALCWGSEHLGEAQLCLLPVGSFVLGEAGVLGWLNSQIPAIPEIMAKTARHQSAFPGRPAGPLLRLWLHHLTTVDFFIDQHSQVINPPYSFVEHLNLLLGEKTLPKITLQSSVFICTEKVITADGFWRHLLVLQASNWGQIW